VSLPPCLPTSLHLENRTHVPLPHQTAAAGSKHYKIERVKPKWAVQNTPGPPASPVQRSSQGKRLYESKLSRFDSTERSPPSLKQYTNAVHVTTHVCCARRDLKENTERKVSTTSGHSSDKDILEGAISISIWCSATITPTRLERRRRRN
jgi:hypothetical protein